MIKDMLTDFNTIAMLPVFQHIPGPRLRQLLERINPEEKRFKPEGTILFQGDTYDHLYLLTAGSCYGEILDSTGRKIKVEEFLAPTALGPAVLFASQNRMPGTVRADSDCLVMKISRQDILSLCSENLQFLNNFLNLISDKFLFISNRMSFLAFKTIKGKLAKYILDLPPAADGSRHFLHSLEELADFFGVSRPSLSRVLSGLEEACILQRDGRQVVILDQQQLTHFFS